VKNKKAYKNKIAAHAQHDNSMTEKRKWEQHLCPIKDMERRLAGPLGERGI
jgi:hypothetical protein